jgi:aminoglycoside phosphotransferase (APT) family kinase protein
LGIDSRISASHGPALDAGKGRLGPTNGNEPIGDGTSRPYNIRAAEPMEGPPAAAANPVTTTPLDSHQKAARELLHSLGLVEQTRPRELTSGHRSSIPLVAQGQGGRTFLLKYYLPSESDSILPVGARAEDYSRHETGFYRLLDSIDPERRDFPAPRTIAVGPGDTPGWLLLEWIDAAVGPVEEALGQDLVVELLHKLATVPTERLMGRRGFPIEHWDPIGYLDRIRGMYDAVLFVLGEARWRHLQRFFAEAVRWTDGRKHVLVHGDFQEPNIVVTAEGKPFLVDFECVGIGNRDHDFAWFWLHSTRHREWKRQLLLRWLGNAVGGDRIRAEWGIRSAVAYLAIRRLRWGYLTHGDDDPRQSPNLALLDAAIEGGAALFPTR